MVDKNSIIEKWREESYRPKESTMSDSHEKVSNVSSSEKPIDILVKEPEYAPEDSVRLPIIKQNTNIKDIMNQDIYKTTGMKTLRANSSVPEITFRHDPEVKKKREGSKYSSLHSHTRSQASIFKEKYDKNLQNYLVSVSSKRYNKNKNASSLIGMLMSPSMSGSKQTEL